MNAKNKKSNTQSTFNWHVLLIFSLISTITGIYRDGFASIFPFLQNDFHLSRAQLGLHSTIFYLTAAFFAVYSGKIVDLKGPKWSLVFSGSIMGIFYILHSIAPNFLIILIMAGLTGISVSFNIPSVNKGIVKCFSKKQIGIALSLQSMALPIGGLLGALIFPFFGSILGWRKALTLPSAMAILSVLFFSRFYQEKDSNDYRTENKKNIVRFWESFSQLIKKREFVKISVFGFFLGMMGSSITSHFTLFLFLDHNLSETVAGLGFAFVQVGSILGRAAWGIICDKVMKSDKRKTFLSMGILFWLNTIILSIGLRNLNPPVSILFLFAFLAGCFGNGWPGIFSAAMAETVEVENIGIATGIAFLLVRSGLTIAPIAFGYLADVKGSYSLSWFLLGITILFTSLSQYLFSNKRI